MKTTDLIPILLHQLKDGDKYGLEIVESIKTVSNGQIEIKQPTLYTLLKKLEKSKFISSYWQDSEIGGKRHYYKITENGLIQLETFPPIEELLNKDMESETISENVMDEAVENIETLKVEKASSPFDNLFSSTQQDVHETIAPPQEVVVLESSVKESFEPEHTERLDEQLHQESTLHEEKLELDTKVPVKEFDIFDALPYSENENSTPIDDKKDNDENGLVLDNPFYIENKFDKENVTSTNKDVTKEAVVANTNNLDIVRTENKPNDVKNILVTAPTTTKPKLNTVNTGIEYRDYVDYKNDPKIVRSKKIAKLKLCKLSATSVIGLILLFVCLSVCIKHKTTPLFVTVFIVYTLYIVFRFSKLIGDYKTLRLKLDTPQQIYNFKKQIIVRSMIFVGIFLILLIANLVGLKNGGLFSINNFGNFLAPTILSIMLFVDYLSAYIFYKVLLK